MRKLKRIITILSCLVSVMNSFAGDNNQAALELSKVKAAYEKVSNLSMDVLYKLYSNHTSATILEEHKGFYCKQGNENLYMELYGTLTIKNKDYLFVKDDSSKVFMLAKNKATTSSTPSNVDFEKLLMLCTSVTELPAVGNSKGYKLSFGNNELLEMSSVEIYFDKSTFLTDKVILFYNSEMEVNPEKGGRKYIKPRLEINYEHINTTPVFEKKQFDFAKYLKKSGSSWQAQKAYLDFELMDQTNVK